MKKTFMIAAMAALPLFAAAQTTEPETVTKTFEDIADTWIRTDNQNDRSKENTMEFDTPEGKGFYALLGFSYEVPEDMQVQSANLYMVTERVKNKHQDAKLYAYGNDFAENTNYNTEKEYVDAALAGEPILVQALKGQNDKAIFDGLKDEYKSMDQWTNNLNVTDFLKKVPVDTKRVNFLLAQDGTGQIKIFSKEWREGNESHQTHLANFAAWRGDTDLTPRLEVVFVKNTPSGIQNVADDENAPVEYYNLNGVKVSGSDLTSGIYVRRQGSKTTKILVK